MPMGVHAVDGMIDLCGPIDHVFAQSFRRAAPIEADDTTSILFRMKEGMSGYLGTMTTTGPGFSFQVFGSKGWLRLEGVTHVAGASSEERRTRLFGTCKFQPVKGEAKVWQAAPFDSGRATIEAFARRPPADRLSRSRTIRSFTASPPPRPSSLGRVRQSRASALTSFIPTSGVPNLHRRMDLAAEQGTHEHRSRQRPRPLTYSTLVHPADNGSSRGLRSTPICRR